MRHGHPLSQQLVDDFGDPVVDRVGQAGWQFVNVLDVDGLGFVPTGAGVWCVLRRLVADGAAWRSAGGRPEMRVLPCIAQPFRIGLRQGRRAGSAGGCSQPVGLLDFLEDLLQ
jgi:hypothetical protein